LPLWPPPRGALLLTLCAPSPPASPYPPYTPTLALHDALPISDLSLMTTAMLPHGMSFWQPQVQSASIDHSIWFLRPCRVDEWLRSEEHTSELRSRFELVCRLLLEKKK